MSEELSKPLFAYALRLLGRRWYSVAEMEKKLKTRQKKWKVGLPEDIAPIIERLKQLKYLDDRNFARLFSESSLRQKPQGQKMLALRLKQKGIAANVISETLAQQNLDEYKLAAEAVRKKLLTLHESSFIKRKEKLYRFLLARGFSHSTSMEVLRYFK